MASDSKIFFSPIVNTNDQVPLLFLQIICNAKKRASNDSEALGSKKYYLILTQKTIAQHFLKINPRRLQALPVLKPLAVVAPIRSHPHALELLSHE